MLFHRLYDNHYLAFYILSGMEYTHENFIVLRNCIMLVYMLVHHHHLAKCQNVSQKLKKVGKDT